MRLLKQGPACCVVATVDSSCGERLGVADSGWVTSTPPYFGVGAAGVCAGTGAPGQATTSRKTSRTSGRESVMGDLRGSGTVRLRTVCLVRRSLSDAQVSGKGHPSRQNLGAARLALDSGAP